MLSRNWNKAIADYAKALSLKTNRLQTTYYNRGEVYLTMRRYSEALADFNEAFRNDSNYIPKYAIYRGRGHAHFMTMQLPISLRPSS
jgi:tetratricopeptide (TPR) repeat protein